MGLSVLVEVEPGLIVSNFVVSARRQQHLDGSLLLGGGVVKLPDLGIGCGKGVSVRWFVIQAYRFAGHGRYVTFQMAEVAVPWHPFREILRRIDGLCPRPAPV